MPHKSLLHALLCVRAVVSLSTIPPSHQVIATVARGWQTLISQEVYDEEGPEVVHKLNIFALS